MLTRFLAICWFALAAIVPVAQAAEPLEAEQAFHLTARALDAKTIEARWDIAPEYYLYRHMFRFEATSTNAATVQLGEPDIPKGKEKVDDLFGKVETYHDQVVIRIPVVAGSGDITLKATAQGCWEGGICYPPMTQEAKFSLAVAGTVPPAPTISAKTDGAPAGASGDESGRIAKLLKGSGLWLAVATFFGFGLLLSLTPCVFPMIPILSGIIVNHGHAVTHARAFTLSLAYVLGMAVTYAIVGVAAGLSGTLLSAALQNAWVLGAFALVFVVLSFSMFGFYELQLPAALQSKLSDTANQQGGPNCSKAAASGSPSPPSSASACCSR